MGIHLEEAPKKAIKSQYKELLQHILDNGFRKGDRTGVGTISTFGYQCRFNLQEGFPIVTEKRTAFKMAITELIWMIGSWMKEERYEGIQRTNIRFLLDNDCHIWTEWPYKAYCQCITKQNENSLIEAVNFRKKGRLVRSSLIVPLNQKEYEERIISDKKFAIEFGDLGPVYQKQWRDFEGKKNTVDQLMTMINRLNSNPDCRRNLTSFWNPTELDEMSVSGLPPCHLLHQVWTRELGAKERYKLIPDNARFSLKILSTRPMKDKDDIYDQIEYTMSLPQYDFIPKRAISLQMYQRSSDCFLGVPFDWVWYAALTHMLAELTNMAVGEFIWVSGDTHLYTNSIEESKEVLDRETFPYPKFNVKRKVENIEDYRIDDFELIDYKCGKQIKVAVAV